MQAQTQLSQFRDSINREYAEYLERSWEQFTLQQAKQVPVTPLPDEDTRYIEDKDTNPPTEVVVDSIVPTPLYQSVEKFPSVDTQKKKTEETIKLSYFDTPIEISKFEGFGRRLVNVQEKQIASFWRQLSHTPYQQLIQELLDVKEEMYLNDWGFYQLILQVSDVYYLPVQVNEKTVFSIFILNQTGYRAKIGRVGNTLISLLAFQTEVYGKPFLHLPDGNYYVISADAISGGQVFSYRLNYEPSKVSLNLTAKMPVRLSMQTKMREITVEKSKYTIEYNENLITFYQAYPQTEFSVYANTPISVATCKSLEKELTPFLKEKSEREAVGYLIYFVQKGFAYKTDTEQLGHEKCFFAEEMFHFPFSDCEDRAILFSHLVRSFLGLEVVLLDYDDHVATAVKFKSNEVSGDYVDINKERYVVCDPTYIGAPIGRAMTRYKNKKARILFLN
ncbi:hypothetical protein AGMMS49574_14780 [Bacteroidia bacterium]|nr:hypothetical protein AGMMS49574_14780 [Bacteroidia bacterium]